MSDIVLSTLSIKARKELSLVIITEKELSLNLSKVTEV
jgi:hypothetical protein